MLTYHLRELLDLDRLDRGSDWLSENGIISKDRLGGGERRWDKEREQQQKHRAAVLLIPLKRGRGKSQSLAASPSQNRLN